VSKNSELITNQTNILSESHLKAINNYQSYTFLALREMGIEIVKMKAYDKNIDYNGMFRLDFDSRLMALKV
jgi:hypothetical protein